MRLGRFGQAHAAGLWLSQAWATRRPVAGTSSAIAVHLQVLEAVPSASIQSLRIAPGLDSASPVGHLSAPHKLRTTRAEIIQVTKSPRRCGEQPAAARTLCLNVCRDTLAAVVHV